MNQSLSNDTIIALSSGQGRTGVSVLRISGPQADLFLKTYCRGAVPEPRMSALRWIYDEDEQRVDQALVLRFVAPDSFTGEDVIELHCHGSLAVVDEVLRLACLLPGYRIAERGEFSQRAFENEKLDLVQIEGISDLIESTTTKQMQQAARFLSGDASSRIEAWRKQILEASAYLAASIDFSDEGDVGESPHGPVLDLLSELETEFSSALDRSEKASRVRDGIRVAIMGAPNVGKSTLMNLLVERDAAIISDIAGTTRDVLEVSLVLNGVPVLLADTAGIRETEDPIEAEGVRRARKWAAEADIRLFLSEIGDDTAEQEADIDLWIGTKADLPRNTDQPFDVKISATTGEGIDALKSQLSDRVAELTSLSEAPSIVRRRHQFAIEQAIDALRAARALLTENDDVDLAAFELSLARTALDQILGRVDVEDILGEVFSGFCVGK